jgi:predicted nucleotidyltransferase
MYRSIDDMAKKLYAILGDNILCIYLYGSVVMDDFKLGWSDIDILCLTKGVVSDFEAEQLVDLRQNLLKDEESNQYYRSFEGAIVSIDEFKKKQYTRVVYWGTSGQRIADKYSFDVFSLYELIKYGQLIFGKDIRNELVLPTYEELKYGVQQHYQTIRKDATKTGENIYSCGWFLDIARCIYTLRYNDIISKTKAGEWAINENLCPEGEHMLFTLKIRNKPLKYKEQAEVKEWLSSLETSVQLFADVLEIELNS